MAQQEIKTILETLERYLLGKRRQLEYALACLLARGHLLIEDVPGVGKTTLARSLANCIDAQFKRVQFTSDLLPSDLIGVTVFHQSTGTFEFQPGPIFTNVLLADEINRGNPKTQSALLEAMHDAQVTHDGISKPLPSPFFVLATQNSRDHHGTFPLPESQLDRFLMRLNLGYPAESYEKRVIRGDYLRDLDAAPKIDLPALTRLQGQAAEIHVGEDTLDFMYRLIEASRQHPAIKVGVSPRGGQALYRASQAIAYVHGRDFATPDDVIALVKPVLGHRILLKHGQIPAGRSMEETASALFDEILGSVPPPR